MIKKRLNIVWMTKWMCESTHVCQVDEMLTQKEIKTNGTNAETQKKCMFVFGDFNFSPNTILSRIG